MKFGLSNWNEPTPVKIRRISGAIGFAGIAGCGFALIRDEVWIGVVLLVCAVFGTLICKLFADAP